MTNRDNLPAIIITKDVALSTEQSGSLVVRGLEAIKNRSRQALSIPTMDLLHDMESRGFAVRASLFTVDNRIAKTHTAIAELQEKYKAAFEKKKAEKEDGRPASKLMLLVESRLTDLKGRLDGFNKEKADNKLTPEQMKELQYNSFRIIGPDQCAWLLHNKFGPQYPSNATGK